jgi:hypothetical protein
MVLCSLDGLGIEEIEANRVPLQIGLFQETRPQGDPFFLAELALEHGFSDPDAIIGAGASDAPEAAGASFVGSGDIVGDQNEHFIWG